MRVTVTVESDLGDVEVRKENSSAHYTFTSRETPKAVRDLIWRTADQAILAYPDEVSK